ncbi:MAG: hypothetical protein U0Y10_09745 [Spirosomataceae bacterium]
MAIIEIEVSDEYLKKKGTEALRERIQQEIELDELHEVAVQIDEAVTSAGLHHDQLWKASKSKAWQHYKEKFLNDILH